MFTKFACLHYFKTNMSSRTVSSMSESLPTITKRGIRKDSWVSWRCEKNILILYKASFPQIVASLKLMLSHISHMTVGQGRYSCSKIFLESFFLRLFIPIFTDIYFLTGLVLKDEFHSLNEYLQWFCPSSELSVLAIKKCIYMIFSYALHPLYALNRNSN